MGKASRRKKERREQKEQQKVTGQKVGEIFLRPDGKLMMVIPKGTDIRIVDTMVIDYIKGRYTDVSGLRQDLAEIMKKKKSGIIIPNQKVNVPQNPNVVIKPKK